MQRYTALSPESERWYARAQGLFPGGVTHDSRFLTPYPIYVDRAAGSRKWDVDGHFEAVEVEVGREVGEREVIELFEGFKSPDEVKGLPTAPTKPIIYRHEPDRPQHRYDVNAGEPEKHAWGMAVSVGRVRVIDNWVRFVLISHNTRRGAAPGSILNAELANKRGFLS